MNFSVKEIDQMIIDLNKVSNHEYLKDSSYGGFRLDVKTTHRQYNQEGVNTMSIGQSTITKNNRYSRNDFGQFLSDLLEFVQRENQKKPDGGFDE